MTAADGFSYVVTLVAIAIAPGPVVLMLMVRAASGDVRGAAGFGLGFERMLMYLTGMSNIRDAIPYPRTVGQAGF